MPGGVNLGEFGKATIVFEADLVGLRRDLRAAQASFERETDRMRAGSAKTGKAITAGLIGAGLLFGLSKLSGAVDSVVGSMTRAARAAVDLGRELTKVGGEFEHDLALVGTLSNEARGSIDAFRRDVVDLGLDGGRSFKGLNKALFDDVSGMQDAAQARVALSAANDLAVAGATELDTAMSALVRVIRGFNLDVSDSQSIADKLFASMQGGVVDVAGVAENVGKLASVAASAGLTLDEMFGAIARSTQIENAEVALTAMRNVLIKVSASTDKVREDSRAMAEEMGVVGFEFSKAHLEAVGLVQFMRELDVVVAGDNARLAKFGILARTLTGALSLLGDGTDELAAQIQNVAESEGLVAEQARIMGAQTQNQMRRMENAVEAFKVLLFKDLIEPWLGGLQDLELTHDDLATIAAAAGDAIRLAFSGAALAGASVVAVLADAAAELVAMVDLAQRWAHLVPGGTLIDLAIPDDELEEFRKTIEDAAQSARDLSTHFAGAFTESLPAGVRALDKVKAALEEIAKRRADNERKRKAREAAGPVGSFGGFEGISPEEAARRRMAFERATGVLPRGGTKPGGGSAPLPGAPSPERTSKEIEATKAFFDELRELAIEHNLSMASLEQTETERQVAAFHERFRVLREEMQAAGVSTLSLDAILAAGEDQIRGTDQAALDSDDPLAGFTAGIRNMKRELGGLGQIGAGVATTFGAIGGEVAGVALGLSSADDAAKRFLMNLVANTIAGIANMAVLAGLSALVSGGTTATAGSAAFGAAMAQVMSVAGAVANFGGATATSGQGAVPGAQFGGEFRVGGTGGVDRNLVALHASRGELVQVGRPTMGGGSFNVSVENLGPPVRASSITDRGVDAHGVRQIAVVLEGELAGRVARGRGRLHRELDRRGAREPGRRTS